jgi:hypothetical protein
MMTVCGEHEASRGFPVEAGHLGEEGVLSERCAGSSKARRSGSAIPVSTIHP